MKNHKDIKDITVKMIETDDERAEWNKLSSNSDVGSMYQCLWWAEPLERYDVKTEVISVWNNDRLLGGALFRSVPIPYTSLHITQCLDGPIFLEWEPAWADELISKLVQLARKVNSIEVAIEGCQREDVHRDITVAFRRAKLTITLTPGVTQSVIPLENRTLDDIWKGFNKGTKWEINKARRDNIQVINLLRREDLRSAYNSWLATAKRKGFTDIRPWETLEPVLRYCVANECGTVLAGFRNEELLASIFVAHVGKESLYVYGGFIDGAEKYSPNKVMHHEVIKQCFEKGIKAYSFGNLTWDYKTVRSGVDQFKLGFGSIPQQKLETVTWKRKPLLVDCRTWLHRSDVGRKLAALLKRHVIKRERAVLKYKAYREKSMSLLDRLCMMKNHLWTV